MTHPAITAAATAFVNQRVMRNGSPSITNALLVVPERLRKQILEDATVAVLVALRHPSVREPGRLIGFFDPDASWTANIDALIKELTDAS